MMSPPRDSGSHQPWKEEGDVNPEGKSDTTVQQPRRSKRLKTKVDYNTESSPEPDTSTKTLKETQAKVVKAVKVRTKRGNAGRLSHIHNIPTDIFLEIASHLHPLDILNLARTTRAWRTILMSRTSKPVWRAARSTVPELPDCPADLSEAEYVRLVFQSDCYSCGTSSVPGTDFALRMRLCKGCSRGSLFQQHQLHLFFPGHSDEVLELVPYTQKRYSAVYWTSDKHYYHIDSVKTMLAEMAVRAKQPAEQYQKWLEDRKMLVAGISEHARAVQHWLPIFRAQKATVKQEAIDRKRAKTASRQAAIVERFIALGYDRQDIIINSWSENSGIWGKAQELSDRIWANIRQPLEDEVIQNRTKRMEEERLLRLKSRKEELYNAFKSKHSSVSMDNVEPTALEHHFEYPSRADFLYLPSVRSLWEDSSEAVGSSDWLDSPALALEIGNFIQSVKGDVLGQLVQASNDGMPGRVEAFLISQLKSWYYPSVALSALSSLFSTADGFGLTFTHVSGLKTHLLTHGSLETTLQDSTDMPVSPCASASEKTEVPCLSKATSVVTCTACHVPLHWPALLEHAHTVHSTTFQWPNKEQEVRWSAESVYASKLHYLIIKGILDAAGLEPDTATSHDLKSLGNIKCLCCERPPEPWNEFFIHFARNFYYESRNSDKTPSHSHDPRDRKPIAALCGADDASH